MSKIQKLKYFIKRRQYWLLVGAAAILLILLLTSLRGNSAIETVSVKQEDLVKTVRIAGKVTPRERVDLAFEISGTVASAPKQVGSYVARGEIVANLSSGTISAEIQKAQAELASAQAELSKIDGTQAFETTVANSKRSVVQAMKDAYTTASDAIGNKADQVFIDPQSSRPEVAGSFDDNNSLREFLGSTRITLGYMLVDWRKLVDSLASSSYTEQQLALSKDYLSRTSFFISELSRAVNMFEVTSYMTQTQIDQHKASILSARNALGQASQGFIDADKSYTQTLSDVPVQLARVEAARATVANLQYQRAKTSLTSPINGVVSKQDAKPGQAVTAGVQLVTVISPDYIIETYVPEVSIAGIRLGNIARVTLDAYGDTQVFEAKVDQLDPAETTKDGVSTYKVKLAFTSRDERVRSGMTANVQIETLRKSGTTLIQERSILKEEGASYVYILDENNNKKKISITVGERDSKGNVELLGGLEANARVVLNPGK